MGVRPSRPVVPYEEAVERMSPATRARLQKLFQEMTSRSDLSGAISPETFNHTLAVPFLDWGPKVLGRLFEVLDTEGKRALGYKEFMSAAFVFYAGTKDEKMQLVFKMFDTGNTEVVSRTEFEAMASGMLLRDSDVEAEVEVEDVEGDGEGGEGEGRRVMAQVGVEALAPLEDTIGAMSILGFDRDEDGKLQYEEWCTWAHQSEDIQRFVNAMDQVIRDDDGE